MAINVIIIDDSAVVRQVMSQVLTSEGDINVYAVANDPIFAYAKMEKQWPDVIVLDIEMPRMDGITFLKKVMKERPTPVVICSSLAEKGAALSLAALASGAVDIVTKPQIGVKGFLESADNDLRSIVRAAAKARLSAAGVTNLPLTHSNQAVVTQAQVTEAAEAIETLDLASLANTTDKVIGIGSSTGGTIALETILSQLPRTVPGIVVVQHMPEKFTAAFAERLNSICAIEVLEATSGDRVIPGRALIAPGGKHLQVKRSGGQYITLVSEGPAVNRHCPSVDVLFKSLASNVKHNATGVILTGMGNDGAQGLLAMKKSGSVTYAQNEVSCIVFGMPKEAIKLNAAMHVVHLNEVASLLAR